MATKAKSKGSKGKTTKMQPLTVDKMTAAEARARVVELEEELENEKGKLWCHLCGKKKNPDHFYVSSDARSKSGYAPICKECSRVLAERHDINGEKHEVTKDSVMLTMYYLGKPMLDKVWDASVAESLNENAGITKNNAYSAYIKNIQMVNYLGETFLDSDMFKTKIIYEDEKTAEDVMAGREDQDTYSDFLKNKADVTRLLSYDPFEKEAISDQPFLYSQLLGLLDADESGNDDMMRTASCISIVRGFLQLSKIDDTIAKLMGDLSQVQNNSATIKSLQESKGKVTGMIKDLAAESCISLRNSKNAKKGENTFTGKLQKLATLGIRESAINGFDVETCKGMQQVANISMNAIVDKLKLDDSEWAAMVAEQRKDVINANNKASAYAEAVRILLLENVDLRKALDDAGLLNKEELLNLDDVVNTYIDNDGDVLKDKENEE